MSISGARLLLVLPQLPQDPASGAARSTRTMCEMLSAAGIEVRAVATTATERASKVDSVAYLKELGITPHIDRGHTKERVRPEIRFDYRGIHYSLLDVGPRNMHAWQKLHGRQFDRMFDDELHRFKPDLVLGFGGLPGDVRRFERAKRQGARLVFALRNKGYLRTPLFFLLFDGVLTPSQFLSDLYRSALGIESTPLPTPIELDDVLAPERDPIFVTMINPSAEKGLMLVARLAEELSQRRPDVAMMFIESRGTAGRLVQAGLVGGFDLRRHENLMLSPPLAHPRDIYLATRTLLIPSIVEEASGRVAAEALVNGIPPLVSDRGGLTETRNGAGFTLPLPPKLVTSYPIPVEAAVVEPWIELIIRLEDDQEFYLQESEKARAAGLMYLPEQLTPRYLAYFEQVMNAKMQPLPE